MSAPPKRLQRGLVTALMSALLCWAPSTAQAADTVRSAEWQLDTEHFDAEKVWAVTKGEGVTVAVVDSGVSVAHPDLAGQVAPGTSFLGDGGDGRSDVSAESHGTAVAGVIAASGGPNHTGMTGLAPSARILPVRVTAGDAASPSLLARGITWAVDHGARVINISMGTPQPDALLHQAIQYAIRQDVVVVASAGNSGNTDNLPQYPAAYPGVVSVAGTKSDGAPWSKSQSGHGIALAAPATDILSTNDQNAYVSAEGTSYSAAYVSAAAALVRSHFPGLSAGQVIRRLIDTADHHHPTPDAHTGYGTIAPLRALTDPTPPTTEQGNPLLSAPTAAAPSGSKSTLLLWAASACITAVLIGAALIWKRQRQAVASPHTTHLQTASRKKLAGTARQSGKQEKGRSSR